MTDENTTTPKRKIFTNERVGLTIIGLMFGWIIGILTMTSSLENCRDSSAKLQRKLDDAERANATEKLDHLKEITKLIGMIAPPKQMQPSDSLEHGAISLEMSIGSLDEMQKQQAELQKQIVLCFEHNKGPFTLELLDRIKIKQGSASYFLVIEELTSPMAAALYDYFWNSSNAWARSGANHGVFVMYSDKLP